MARPVFHLHPQARRVLSDLGARIALARARRSMTRTCLAQRAGITVFTLRRVESGEIGVTIGAYLAVLYALGLVADVNVVADADLLGRDLQDAAVVQRPRRSPLRPRPPRPSVDEPERVTTQSLAESAGQSSDTHGSGDPAPDPDDQGSSVSSSDILAYLVQQGQ